LLVPALPSTNFLSRLWCSIVCGLALITAVPKAVGLPEAADHVRALWVTRATLTSPDAVAKMVRAAQSGGFNALLVQVRGRGDAYYRSSLEPRALELAGRPDFDPLALTIEQAHAAGIAVHGWVPVNLVASATTLPSSRDHIVYKNPEWLMVPRALVGELSKVSTRSPEYLGRLARWTRAHKTEVEGLYASPIHQAAAAHVADVVKELASRYELDGIHLDYARFPSSNYDFSRGALQAFKESVQPDVSAAEQRTMAAREAVDPLAYPKQFPARWDTFRRSRLTALVMRVRTAVRSVRPSAVVSAAVFPDAREAYQSRLQDWRTWIDQSLIDVLCPMAYTQDARIFDEQIALAQQYAGGRPVWAGIGAYRLASRDTLRFITSSRRLGAPGVILFSYDALVSPPNTASTLTDLGRAAFGAGSY
jgi:uncharacterized lipoprotein YddW (UPF0748 family)